MKCDINALKGCVEKEENKVLQKMMGFVWILLRRMTAQDAARFALLLALIPSLFVACSDSEVAGGSSDDAGIYAVKDLNVAGLTQKGPFAKGSAVTVQGIDCQTMELTDEKFTGSVKSDKGDFGVEDVNLSATCALFEVTGYYFNELTGKKSSEKMTLHALTDLKDRKNVNINLLTQLEYERVMNLVTKKDKSFADAKKQAEKEVLAAFNVKAKDGEFAQFEDLNILEKGDDNAALLAVSVLMQSDLKVAKLTERVNDVAADIAKDGSWDDDKTKTEIAEWAATADKNGELANVGKNIEKWGGSDEASAFETVVEKFADSNKGTSSSSVTSAGSVTLSSSSSKNVLSSSSSVIASETKQSSSAKSPSSGKSESTEGTMTDARDGKKYKTVKIGNQVWMAENLNYETKNSYCYNDSTTYCEKYGRLYTWATAVGKSESECGYRIICSLPSGNIQGVCPDGWHLPDTSEWRSLISAVGGSSVAGKILKSQLGWKADTDKGSGNGTDDFGFSALSAGVGYYEGYYNFEGISAFFWSSTENDSNDTYGVRLDYVGNGATLYYYGKDGRFSVRCLKDGSETVPASSSSSVIPASSGNLPSSSSSTEGRGNSSIAKDSYFNPNIDYGKMTDSRDGQVYKTLKIGNQVWMAENLNYDYRGSKSCYESGGVSDCSFGRYYSWAMAVDSATLRTTINMKCGYERYCGLTETIRGVCPEGWHLPDTAEFRMLFDYVVKTTGDSSSASLKTVGEWAPYVPVDGDDYDPHMTEATNVIGFSIRPSGRYYCEEYGLDEETHDELRCKFESINEMAKFWTSGDRSGFYAYVFATYNDYDFMRLVGAETKSNYHPVRCVKD